MINKKYQIKSKLYNRKNESICSFQYMMDQFIPFLPGPIFPNPCLVLGIQVGAKENKYGAPLMIPFWYHIIDNDGTTVLPVNNIMHPWSKNNHPYLFLSFAVCWCPPASLIYRPRNELWEFCCYSNVQFDMDEAILIVCVFIYLAIREMAQIFVNFLSDIMSIMLMKVNEKLQHSENPLICTDYTVCFKKDGTQVLIKYYDKFIKCK